MVMEMTELTFSHLLQAFFLKWMSAGKNLSLHTIHAYRDTFSLFFGWLDETLGIEADAVTMNDFLPENIADFLEYLANTRRNSPRTINCRLAAIHSFCRFALYKNPQNIDSLRAILDLPKRKVHVTEVDYLTAEEIAAILDECNLDSKVGKETHLMIVLLFNTGARISELIAVKKSDIAITGKRGNIRFIGKGRKERCLPLWEETLLELTGYIKDKGLQDQEYLFPGRNVDHITRSGARSRLDSVISQAVMANPELAGKRISPHTFRHSTAMTMLQAGIELSTIAIWLGHEQIETTHKYMIADMALKEAAIAKVHPVSNREGVRYKAPVEILSFLEAL